MPIINSSLVHIGDTNAIYVAGMPVLGDTHDKREMQCYYTYQRILYAIESSVIHFIKLLSKNGLEGGKKSAILVHGLLANPLTL